MTVSMSFEQFYGRFAGKQLSEQNVSHAGAKKAVAQSANTSVQDQVVSGEAEYRQLFGRLSSWYGNPGSTATELKAPEGGALMRAVDAMEKAARPERPAAARPVVRNGSVGADVKSAQSFLALRGFSPGPQDGVFGPKTENAVRNYQQAKGLSVDGVVGPKTWQSLLQSTQQRPAETRAPQTTAPQRPAQTTKTLEPGATGPEVQALQTQLAARGYSPGPQDGVFGQQTDYAVRTFQRANGLIADGIVGPQTWDALRHPGNAQNVTPRTPAANDSTAPSTPANGLHARLNDMYTTGNGYANVRRNVRGFYPPDRKNGCVAYMSEALRQAGYHVPIANDRTGENISLTTKPFSNYLEKNKGWQRVGSMNDLRPGDVAFTKDDPKWPGYPAHTFMFAGWHDKSRGVAWVVDNQDQKHLRDLNQDDYGNFNFTPFAYALRAPGN